MLQRAVRNSGMTVERFAKAWGNRRRDTAYHYFGKDKLSTDTKAEVAKVLKTTPEAIFSTLKSTNEEIKTTELLILNELVNTQKELIEVQRREISALRQALEEGEKSTGKRLTGRLT